MDLAETRNYFFLLFLVFMVERHIAKEKGPEVELPLSEFKFTRILFFFFRFIFNPCIYHLSLYYKSIELYFF